MSRGTLTADVTPQPDARGCEAPGCSATDLLAEVDPNNATDARVLCPEHRVEFLREVSDT